MTAAEQRIADELRHYPEVRWDRFTEYDGNVRVYGWLDRDDGRADFLLLDFAGNTGALREWCTSAAPHPASVVERLEGDESVECQRVEDRFDVPNAVRLSPDPPQPEGEERVKEARGELSSALGFYRLDHGKGDHIETRLARALDRLDRVVQGEDYIEQWRELHNETGGAVHFREPRAEVQPDPPTPQPKQEGERWFVQRCPVADGTPDRLHGVVGGRHLTPEKPAEWIEVVPASALAEAERRLAEQQRAADTQGEMAADAERRAEGWHRKAARFRARAEQAEAALAEAERERDEAKGANELNLKTCAHLDRERWRAGQRAQQAEQARDTAQAEVKRLREALERIEQEGPGLDWELDPMRDGLALILRDGPLRP